MYQAHLLPENREGLPWEVLPPISVHDLGEDFPQMIRALEDEFTRAKGRRGEWDKRDRAILVHVSENSATSAEDSMAELAELARSAGIKVVHRVFQRRSADSKFVLGKGKLQDTVIKAMQVGAEVVIFDLNLTPAQVRSIAEYTDLKVLDRTQVILDIFAQHAQTREGKIQVELAQLRYLLPRLSDKHSAMSRLTGGIGGRGPGETKLEIDRRRAQDRLALLQHEVEKLGDRRKLRRSVRTRNQLPVIAVVGYTNAGKSTLLNNLTQSSVVADNILFATLNPVSRRLRFPKERDVIITDTVGFIRELPEDLMAAFRTTFEEVGDADLLLHVVDASSPNIEEKMATVGQILADLDLNQKPAILVLNKIDLCEPSILDGLSRNYGGIQICAQDPQTFTLLLEEIEHRLWPQSVRDERRNVS